MKKCVIFVDNGMIQDVLTNSKEDMQFMVVDFDRRSLDQSALKLLTGPFQDVAALADVFKWDAAYDPARVKEIFRSQSDPESCLLGSEEVDEIAL
jgi:hypothetical protein